MRAGLARLILLMLVVALATAPLRAQSGPVQPLVAEQPASSDKHAASQGAVSAPAASASESPKAAPGPAVEASPLDTFLLRDSKGNLVPVLGMPFEEFEHLLRLKRGLVSPPAPGYSLDALALVAAAEDRVANLQITATIRVRDAGWVRVPLQMPSAVVTQRPKHEGPGEHFLWFDATSGGYLCCLKGSDAQPHVVTLQAAVGLTNVGDETRLALSLPRATESSLRLTTSQPSASASLTSGEGIVSTRAAGGRSEITVLGAAGELRLAWHAAREEVSQWPAQLAASGEILVRVESEHRVTSDARLRVRSYGGLLDVFQVRLPPGMELAPPFSRPGYAITPILPAASTAGSAENAAPGQLVEVRLDKPATTWTEVRISTTLPADANPTAGLTPARFEVVGAVRQSGTIDFTVEGEWQLEWTEDASVRRLDPTAETAIARPVARFDYFRQPCGLELRVAARPSRVGVEPTHKIDVDAQQVRIESTFKYRFRGSRAAGLTFELGDWKFDRLSPDDLFDIPVVQSDPAGQVQVPFRLGATLPTELELKLEAHRVLPPQTEHIALVLPRPLADIIAPATIRIDAADNVELTPQTGQLVGLSPEPTIVRIPQRQQSSLVYRDLGGSEPSLFAATMRIRARATSAVARAAVRLDRQQMQVEQRLDYRIAHEPALTFRLVAPRSLTTGGGLQVWFNQEPLSAKALAEGSATSAAQQRLEFATPSEQIGAFSVVVRYALPMPRWDGQKPLPLTIPLVLPADEGNYQFAGQQIDFTLGEGLQIEPELAGVDELSRPTALSSSGPAHAFTWSAAATSTRWIVQPAQAAETSAVTVTKAWVQTWLAPRVRQERLALRLTTQEDSLRVNLPKGAQLGSVQAALNAQEIAVHVRERGVVLIDLPLAVRGRECVLEMWYAVEPPGRRAGILSGQLRPAEIEGAAPPRRLYWQLSLPENEQLLVPPGEMEAEMAWSAEGWRVGQQPLLDQRQLEYWIGASRQDPLPRGVNQFLFGTLGRMPTFDLLVMQRRLLVSLAAGSALAVGLLLVHIPRLRNPGWLWAAATVLAAIAVAEPHLAVLAGQWCVLGLVVALAATAWAWFGSGRMPWLVPATSSAVARLRESASTQPPAVRPERSSQITTAAAPAGAAAEVRP